MDLNGRQKLLDATFGAVCETTGCSEERRRTLEEVVNLAVELAREGREGRKIGTLFVIGDVEVVTEQSRPLILDPLFGHDDELLRIELPEFRETVKELAQLDGAFLLGDDGTFVSAGRFIDVDVTRAGELPPRSRHATRRRRLDLADDGRDRRRRLAELGRARLRARRGAGRDHPRALPHVARRASSRARPRCGSCPRPASRSRSRPRPSRPPPSRLR